MGEERGAYRVLVGKPEGKRPLGRPRRRWVDNIRMDLQDVGYGSVDWIGLAQDKTLKLFVYFVLDFLKQNAGKLQTIYKKCNTQHNFNVTERVLARYWGKSRW